MSNVTPFSDTRREPAPSGRAASIPQGWDELVASKQQWMGRINAAWRCKWILVFSLIFGLGWGAYRVIEQTPMYRASLSLLLHHFDTYTQQKNVVPGSEDASLSVHNQQELIRSRNMAERVVDSLALEKRSPLLNIPERSFQTEWVGWIASRLEELRAQSGRSKKATGAAYSREAIISMVQGSLTTRGRKNTEILDISVSFPDPDLAMEIANAYAIQFIAMQQEDAVQIANSTSAWLTDRITELKEALDNSERNLQAYRLEQGIGDTKSLVSQSNSKLRELESNVTQTQLELETLGVKYGDKHPTMIATRQHLDEINKLLAAEKSTVLTGRRNEFRLRELESEVEQRNELYQLYLEQLGKTNLAAKLDQKQSKIIDIATRPSSPYSPDEGAILRNTMVWSVAVGLMIISLLVFMDNKFRFPEQAEQILGYPVLGALPLLRGRELSDAKGQPVAPEFFMATKPRSVFSEWINHIHTSIKYSDPDNTPRVIVVSSAMESEGKTTLVTNLALAFSRFGKTLLIDGDLRKPRLSRLSNSETRVGLTELIIGSASADECVSESRIGEGLFLMGSGRVPPDPVELLSSVRFSDLLTDLKKSFDHIVIDSPPILPVTDAIAMSHQADAMILVIQANRTTQWTARMVIKKLSEARVNLIGLVLSKMDTRKAHYYSNYRNYYSEYSDDLEVVDRSRSETA